MRAHTVSGKHEEARIQALCKAWAGQTEFTTGTCEPNDGMFPTDLDELPNEYSVGLCKIVQSCLRFDPDHRTNLVCNVPVHHAYTLNA